jgi:hypothetical protein
LTREHDLDAARGIALGLLLSIGFWLLVGCAAFWL